MKTRIMKALLSIMLMFVTLPMMAQDYVNVNVKNGETNKFYLKDVNAIYTSKFDANGIQGEDYQFQYVTTANGDFVYDLDNIESLTFVKSDEEVNLTDTWYMVAIMGNEEEDIIPMHIVGSLVAIDDAYDFSVLDIDGNVIKEGVLKALFKPEAEIDLTAIRSAMEMDNMLGKGVGSKLTLIGVSGEVNVFDTNGTLQMGIPANGEETVVNISQLPKGIYVVKTGKQTFKFTKK